MFKISSDLLWVFSGRIAAALVAIISLRIMTTLLEPKDIGVYALLTAFQGLSGLLLINPIGQYINRHTHVWWDEHTLLKRLVRYNSYLFLVSLGTSIIVMIWWLFYPGTERTMESALLAALAVGATVYVGTWSGTFIYILNMLGYRKESVIWMISSSAISLISSSFFAYQYHTGISWILGQMIGMTIGAIGPMLILQKYQALRKPTIHNPKVRLTLLDSHVFFTFCIPLATATGLMWLQNTSYRLLVGGVWDLAQLGILTIGLSIAGQIWTITESFSMQFLNPYFYRHITEAQTDYLKAAILSDMINIMWPIYSTLAGFNILFASSLLVALTDVRYHSAVTFVILGTLIEFTRCTTNLWSYASQIQKRTVNLITPYGLGVIALLIGFTVIFYFKNEIKIFPVVLIISNLVTCIVMIIVMQQMLTVTLDIRRWLAGSIFLIIYIAIYTIIPIEVNGIYKNIAAILFGLFTMFGLIFVLLWRNPSLTRLLSIPLQKQ